jgi:hypothetical protein
VRGEVEMKKREIRKGQRKSAGFDKERIAGIMSWYL